MAQHSGLLTPEERARVAELQDLLIRPICGTQRGNGGRARGSR